MRDAIRTEAFQIRIASLMFVLGLCTVAVTQTATQPKNSSSSAPQAMINVLASGGPIRRSEKKLRPSTVLSALGMASLRAIARVGRFTTEKENCISAGYSMVARSRICGLPTRQQLVRKARLAQRFGSLMR